MEDIEHRLIHPTAWDRWVPAHVVNQIPLDKRIAIGWHPISEWFILIQQEKEVSVYWSENPIQIMPIVKEDMMATVQLEEPLDPEVA